MMPNLLYRPRHNPPRWWEHWLAHPPLLALSLASVALALMIGVSGLGGTHWAPIATDMPTWAVVPLVASLALGGIATACGLVVHWSDLADARAVFRAGLLLQAFGWAVRAVLIAALPGDEWSTSAVVSALVSAGLLGEYAASMVAARIIDRTAAKNRGAA